MSLQLLLGEMPKREFVERYFHRFPFSLPRTAHSLCSLGSLEMLGDILTQPTVDVMVAGNGQPYEGSLPRDLPSARQLHREGFTVLVRHAERHHPDLTGLAQSFTADFRAEVNIHLYSTPPDCFGFGWHYDAEDVFIVQTEGAKEYSLRKNTVHPWPLVETIPQDMGFPREIMPLMRVRLDPGDWLYIPCGYWHKAESCGQTDTAVSLAIGVLSPAAIEVFDFVREQLVESLMWRQRLPIMGDATSLSPDQAQSQYRELFQQLAQDLAQTFRDERLVRQFLARNNST